MHFIWTKPGVALGLTEEPVEEGVVAVVVHCHGLERMGGYKRCDRGGTNEM